jgi:signal transduction histidine kinase
VDPEPPKTTFRHYHGRPTLGSSNPGAKEPMTAVNRATERPSAEPAGAVRGDPDRLLDGGWRRLERLLAREGRYATYVDLALATAIFAVSAWWVVYEAATTIDLWFSAALAFPLMLRRRSPVAVFFMIAVVAFTQWLVTGPLPSDVALLIAIYTVATVSPWVWILACTAVLEAGIVMATVRWRPTGNDAKALVYLTGLAFTAVLAGIVVRAVRSQFDWLADRAERLERERDQLATLAAVEERARIAREMHDVVSHNIQVMVTLADGAAASARSDPARAAEVMGEVSGTGREALTDMRRMLGVLREGPKTVPPTARPYAEELPVSARTVTGSGATRRPGKGRPPAGTQAGDAPSGPDAESPTHSDAGDATAPYAPQPGLAELEALVERVRATGLQVKVGQTGRPCELSAAAELTVYRLVQEALTNALKHAESPASVEVRLDFDDPDVTVQVADDGRVSVLAAGYGTPTNMAAAMSRGHGLSGMAERAAAFGGTLEAGPLSGGGWRVSATLRRCRTPPMP